MLDWKKWRLNIDVLDQQPCEDLCKWFDNKWNDQFSQEF